MKKDVIHPYIPATVMQVERWLSEMSEQGWKLTAIRGWRFSFEQTAPGKREYFFFSDLLEKRIGSHHDFLEAKRRYADKKNKINQRGDNIFEIDERKKDNDLGSFFRYRNHFYRSYYLKLTVLSVLLLCILVAVSFFMPLPVLLYCLPIALLLLYYPVSLGILLHSIRRFTKK